MNNWTQVPAGLINAAQQRLWSALGEDAEYAASHMNASSRNLENATKHLRPNGGYKSTPSQKAAREIMCQNFFGIEEAFRYFEVSLLQHELDELAEIPFSQEILKSCKETHILVAVFPISILDMLSIYVTMKHAYLPNLSLLESHKSESFSWDKGYVGWHLIRKGPVVGSALRTFVKQRALLAEDEEVPLVRVLTYAVLGHTLSVGGRPLFEKMQVRCIDPFSDRRCCVISNSPDYGFRIMKWPQDDHEADDLFLSASKKIKT